MKTRPRTTASGAVIRRRSFPLHPLSFAVCMAMSSAALALPQGGKVVTGDASIGTPSKNVEVIKQTSDKAIIDWQSFSIAGGEKVRFYQPSSTSVTLNRVVGYDPSNILGQMSSNGKIFLINPHGVIFGAGARIDVGGLVVSSLSMSDSDFLASRYNLTSVDPVAPAERGEVRNDGTISAPGGLVVLAGPTVTNTGTITAEGGRVGMAAVNSVSIDVGGDGLIFFDANASEAKNRLQQLGRIQADGGTIEMHAEARAALTDTVLNMSGVVQARGLGTREGHVVIDGGSAGSTIVSGQIDVSGRGPGQQGGSAVVEGQQIALADTARIDASGDAGGGTLRIGGGFHGTDASVRDADTVTVALGAQLNADALSLGNGGTVVVWSDHGTTYRGTTSARGGANGGDGGSVEVSGRDSLAYEGSVDTLAPKGKTGTLLLDPTDITISDSASTGTMTQSDGPPPPGTPILFTDTTAQSSTLNTTTLQTALGNSNVIVDTTSGLGGFGTITVSKPILDWANANNLTLKADSTITVAAGATITNTGTGGVNLFTNGGVVLNAAVALSGGTFTVGDKSGAVGGRAVSFTSGAGGTISTAGAAGKPGGAVDIETTGAISTQAITTSGGSSAGNGHPAGSVTLNSSTAGVAVNGAINAIGGDAGGANKDGGAGGAVTLTANGLLTVGADITTAGGALSGSGSKGAGGTIGLAGTGVTVTAGSSVNADDGTIAVDGGGGAIQLGTSMLTTTNNSASAITIQDASTVALGNLTTGASGTTTIGVAGNISGAVTQTPTAVIDTGTLIGSTASSVVLGNANTIATLGAFGTNGALTVNDAGGGLTVSGAVSTANNGVASIATTGGDLAVSAGGSVAGAGVSLTTTGANDITLSGPVNGNAGTVTLASGQAISQVSTGTINTTGALVLSAAGAITLDQGNTIASLGAVTRGGAFTLNDTGGGLTLTGSIGTDATPVSISTAGGALDLGANDIKTTGLGNDITLTGVGVTQTSGAITTTAGGLTTVNAGTGSIGLLSANNDFSGAVTLSSTGASAAVRSANALTLAAPTLGTNTGLTAIAGTTLTVPAGPINTGTGSIDLEANGGALTTPGTLTTSSGAITLVGATGLTVSNGVSSTSGPVSLTGGGAGGLTIASGITVDAGSGTIAASGGAHAVQLNDSTLTTTNNSAGAITIRDATTVALGNLVTGSTGTTTLGVGADITGTLAQNASTSINTGTVAASTAGAITLDKNNAIADLGAVTRGGAFTLNDTGGSLTLSGSVGAAAASVSITAAGLLDLGANNITATTAAGTVALTGVGVTQSTGSIGAGGATSISGGSGGIALQSAANNFTGAVTLDTTGANAAIRSAGALTLAAPTLGPDTGLTAIAGSALTLPAGAINTGAGNLDLRSLGGALSTPGNLTAANISLTGSTGLTLANNLSAGNVTLNTTNAAITESPGATITATGATTFSSGTGTVTLGQPNILNSIGGNGGAVSITEASAGGLALDTINAASLAVDTSAVGGTVSQTPGRTLTVSGATTINAGAAGTVTLANAGNDFGSFGAIGGAVSVSDNNAITLNAITATSLAVDTSAGNGTVTQGAALNVSGATAIDAGGGAITLANAGNALGSFGATGGTVALTEGSAGGVALDNIVATGLSVDTHLAGGAISQTAGKTLTVSGATAINAGVGAVLLANVGNDFGSVGATGGVVSIKDSNGLALDAINATTSLTIDTSAGNGALSQNAAAIVGGPTVVTTGSGAIALNNANNDFSNAAGNSFSGGAITLHDTNALTVTTLANGANQAVNVSAGGPLTLPGGVTTTSDITLSSGATLTTPGTLTGNNVSLTGNAGLTIANDVDATGNLNLSTTAATVNQTTGMIITGGVTTVTAGAGAVTLAQPLNDFNSINVVSGGVVSVNDATALTAAAIASGTLTVTSTGPLTSGGTLSGTTVSLTGNGGINLGSNVIATGTLQLTTTNSAITQTAGAISAVSGLTTVNAGSGDITLNQTGNDFSNAAGITASGGAVRLQDANALKIVGLINGANKDLSLTAGTTITGLAGNIDTGSADLTISAGTGFTTFGTLRGTNVILGGGTGGVSIGNNVTALGNLTLNATNAPIVQTAGTIAAAGTTTATAGTGAITLTQAANDFATFAATGGNVSVVDSSGLALGPVNATTLSIDTSAGNGAITQSGAAVVSGTTSIAAGSGAVTLNHAGNDFANIGVTGGAVSIADSNALALNAVSASSLAVNTSAGNGAVTQTAGSLLVSGATSINAGTGPVTLNNAGNDFGSFGATAGALTVHDTNGVALDAISATALNLSVGGAVTQNAAAVVSGAAAINAGANSVTLGNAGNNFASIGVTGGAVAISDSNALVLDAINAGSLALNTSAGNGAITQNAAAIVGGNTNVNAGTGAVTLTNGGNNFGNVAATGGAVSITDINAVALGAISAASLNVNTSAGNGAVTQTGAAVVAGASTINTGSGAIALTNPGNDFATLGLSGGAINVVDSNALSLSSLTSTPNQAVTVSAGAALTLPATAIDIGSAALSLSSGGALTSVGTLRGANVALASGGAMTLANNLTSLGTLSLTSNNAPITQTAGTIVAAGAATVNAGSGDVTLAQTSNDFQNGVALTGGAVSVHDANNLTVTSLTSGANRPVSLVAGGSLVLPSTAIDTGTADLTLQALGGSLVINSALSGGSVTLTGSAGLAIGANITSSGPQIYTTPVQLAGNVTLDAGASHIDLQGGANGGGNNLALKSSNAAPDAIHTGAPITNTAQFTITGNSSLGGNVTTTGTQTYSGPVLLGADVALASGAAKIDLQGPVDAAGHSLALTSSNGAADAIDAEAIISNAAQLTVTGKSTLAGGVSTTGAQLYSDSVTLGGNASFSGSSLGFGNGIVAGASDLGLQADAFNLAGTVSGSGNASLSSQTQGATVGIAGAAGAFQVSQATLNAFSTFGSLTVGRTDGTGNLAIGNLVLPTNLALQSGSGNASFTGTVASAAGQARDLSVSTGGVTTFAGSVGGAMGSAAALGKLSVAGATQLDANATTSGAQTYGGNLTLGADATLSSSATSLGASLDIGAHSVTLFTDALGIAGSATGTAGAHIRVAPKDAGGSIGVAGGAGALQISQGLVDTLSGVPTLTLGRSDGTGAVTVASILLPADLAINNGSGSVAFTGSVDSAAGPARGLTVNTSGTTSFVGTVGGIRPVGALTVGGVSLLDGNITTSGAQSYIGAATLAADSTLTGPSVAFGSTLDGAHALAVNASTTNLGTAVGGGTALASLTTDAAGTTQINGNVTTSGAQTYNDALSLNANAVLTGSTLHLGASVDGAHTLGLNGSAGVTIEQAVGATTALTSLEIAGPLQLDAGAVTTSGAQSYAGPATLGATTTLTASSIAFASTIDGAFGLTLQSPGTTSLAGAVGATTPLASLAASGGGALQFNGSSIQTSGAQSYSGALLLSGNTRLTGASLDLGGPVSGAADLTLQTNSLTGGASIGGTGTLTIAPIDAALSIGIAGGAGTLQVAQAVLDGAGSFGAHVIGRTDGSGSVSVGNLVLRADTTLQTSTGDINVGGSIDGPFALTLNSGGTTRITGPIGVGTALKSLTTDNNAAAADWNGTIGERTTFDTADGTGSARVVTTGAQTYNDPVTASVPVAFSGGAITATQATNRFDGKVSASADSLQLHSSADLNLGTITLANGGAVDTDGVLHLTGALALNGGTLVLTANATPTAVALTDPAFQGKPYTFGFVPIKEASGTVVEDSGATLSSAAGSLIAFRSPNGGTLQLDQPGNALLGNISAVSGKLDDNDLGRFTNAATLTLGFIRIASSEIHVAGAPPANADQTVAAAGLEGDVIKLTADVLTTGTDGLIRARLPFNNVQGSQTSIPGITFALTPVALAKGNAFGSASADNFVRIQVGGAEGGFVTADPKGVGGENAVIFLGGSADVRPFYDENGKLTEIRIFYNGDAPRTPQEAGALAAVIALIEEARHARFEEAVRTENVSSRLRSGVIAEVGAGRPATVGRESIRLPDTCEVKSGTLLCE